MKMGKIVIIIGSKKDLEFAQKIINFAQKFNVETILHISSAHKTPLHTLKILNSYKGETVVFVTVAGRSNALSGLVDANTTKPVIACPVYGEKFAGADIFSSLRMPSGVCPMVVLEPEEAALAALKILALQDTTIEKEILSYQLSKKDEIIKNDEKIQNSP